MAYFDIEMHNAKLIWANVADRVLVAGWVVVGIVASSQVANWLLHAGGAGMMHP